MPPHSDTSDRRDPGRRLWIWIVYGCLFAASIPWYLPSNDHPPIWLGLPYWVVLSLAATVGIAVFTVFVVFRYWSDPADPESEPDPR